MDRPDDRPQGATESRTRGPVGATHARFRLLEIEVIRGMCRRETLVSIASLGVVRISLMNDSGLDLLLPEAGLAWAPELFAYAVDLVTNTSHPYKGDRHVPYVAR